MARELCYSSEPCWSAERWNCICKSQSNYWGCQGKKLCDNTRNIWANYAPRSINVRLWLKLMSMSRLTNGCVCLFHTDFTKKKYVILRYRRPLILSTNRYTKSRRWLKSWQERYRQVTWNKWSYCDSRQIGKDIEKVCQSVYPLHDVFVRKVKLEKIKAALGKLMELCGERQYWKRSKGTKVG